MGDLASSTINLENGCFEQNIIKFTKPVIPKNKSISKAGRNFGWVKVNV